MEDCGVVYKENGAAKDPYQIFADHNTGIVRLRLWHTPSWYDNLNSGQRYSDLQDVKKSIQRAKPAGMKVLLDFHLSDNWADPNKQRVPAAWDGVVDDLPLLKDSLYNYISQTLLALNEEDLLPYMVQIGNETNKGILQSAADDTGGWQLNWKRLATQLEPQQPAFQTGHRSSAGRGKHDRKNGQSGPAHRRACQRRMAHGGLLGQRRDGFRCHWPILLLGLAQANRHRRHGQHRGRFETKISRQGSLDF
jgi:hypothetical protein